MPDKPNIGFIGLGLMGQAFTKRLVARGYTVTGFDVAADRVEQAKKHGVVAATSSADLTSKCDVILVCVVSTEAVRDAVFGADGVVESASADKLLVDHSTTIVEQTKTMADELRSRTGMGWVDAPVSGGPPAAEAGTLAIMAGGSDADIQRVEPLMNDLASTFTHLGGVGAGQVTKMVNQILVLNNYCILAEALALAEAAGIDASKIPEALAPGHAGSNLLNAAFPRMIARDFEPAGYARQILKDLDMVHDIAKMLKVPTPMSSQAATLFRILVSKGHAEKDGIAVLKLYDQKDTV
jgi:3-hydroxyisobutyrate dehydrogenase-like beta-hydroxyacid dehydrogenase